MKKTTKKLILLSIIVGLVLVSVIDLILANLFPPLGFYNLNLSNLTPTYIDTNSQVEIYSIDKPQFISTRIGNYFQNLSSERDVTSKFNKYCFLYLTDSDKRVVLPDLYNSDMHCKEILRAKDSIIYKPVKFDFNQNFDWRATDEIRFYSISNNRSFDVIKDTTTGKPLITILAEDGASLFVLTESKLLFFTLNNSPELKEQIDLNQTISIQSLVKNNFSKLELLSVPNYLQRIDKLDITQKDFNFIFDVEYPKVIDKYQLIISKEKGDVEIMVNSELK